MVRAFIAICCLIGAGCVTSYGPDARPAQRRFTDRPREVVLSSVLGVLHAMGAQMVASSSEELGKTTVLEAWVIADGIERHAFLLRVAVLGGAPEVWVDVRADLLTADSPLFRTPPGAPTAEVPSRGCGCPTEATLEDSASRLDGPLVLSQQRRLVREVLAGIDASLINNVPSRS